MANVYLNAHTFPFNVKVSKLTRLSAISAYISTFLESTTKDTNFTFPFILKEVCKDRLITFMCPQAPLLNAGVEGGGHSRFINHFIIRD